MFKHRVVVLGDLLARGATESVHSAGVYKHLSDYLAGRDPVTVFAAKSFPGRKGLRGPAEPEFAAA
jgi:hypothetical protein